jgi:hypothetical protein
MIEYVYFDNFIALNSQRPLSQEIPGCLSGILLFLLYIIYFLPCTYIDLVLCGLTVLLVADTFVI